MIIIRKHHLKCIILIKLQKLQINKLISFFVIIRKFGYEIFKRWNVSIEIYTCGCRLFYFILFYLFQVKLIYGRENQVDVPANGRVMQMMVVLVVVVWPLHHILMQMRRHTIHLPMPLQLHRHHQTATVALAVLRADASVVPVHQQDADSAA